MGTKKSYGNKRWHLLLLVALLALLGSCGGGASGLSGFDASSSGTAPASESATEVAPSGFPVIPSEPVPNLDTIRFGQELLGYREDFRDKEYRNEWLLGFDEAGDPIWDMPYYAHQERRRADRENGRTASGTLPDVVVDLAAEPYAEGHMGNWHYIVYDIGGFGTARIDFIKGETHGDFPAWVGIADYTGNVDKQTTERWKFVNDPTNKSGSAVGAPELFPTEVTAELFDSWAGTWLQQKHVSGANTTFRVELNSETLRNRVVSDEKEVDDEKIAPTAYIVVITPHDHSHALPMVELALEVLPGNDANYFSTRPTRPKPTGVTPGKATSTLSEEQHQNIAWEDQSDGGVPTSGPINTRVVRTATADDDTEVLGDPQHVKTIFTDPTDHPQYGLEGFDGETTPGEGYVYTIYNFSEVGWSAGVEQDPIVVDLVPPADIAGLFDSENEEVDLSWEAATGAAGYDIYRAAYGQEEGEYTLVQANAEGTSYSDTGFEESDLNRYFIKSRNADGSNISGFSEEVQVNCLDMGSFTTIALESMDLSKPSLTLAGSSGAPGVVCVSNGDLTFYSASDATPSGAGDLVATVIAADVIPLLVRSCRYADDAVGVATVLGNGEIQFYWSDKAPDGTESWTSSLVVSDASTNLSVACSVAILDGVPTIMYSSGSGSQVGYVVSVVSKPASINDWADDHVVIDDGEGALIKQLLLSESNGSPFLAYRVEGGSDGNGVGYAHATIAKPASVAEWDVPGDLLLGQGMSSISLAVYSGRVSIAASGGQRVVLLVADNTSPALNEWEVWDQFSQNGRDYSYAQLAEVGSTNKPLIVFGDKSTETGELALQSAWCCTTVPQENITCWDLVSISQTSHADLSSAVTTASGGGYTGALDISADDSWRYHFTSL